ncbi:MAG: hypothetical protein U5R48_00500 [Gammaproteobacteria bacterium]|nr:hypothetical protein [Gammaproteobacteria bacterium]
MTDGHDDGGSRDERGALLSELEMLRELLDEKDRPDAAADEEEHIPVLREVVQRAPPERSARPESTGAADPFDPRAFADRLFTDDWRRQRDAILADARRGARALSADPDASLRDDAALRQQLLEALAPRVEEVLDHGIEDLRTALHWVVRAELESIIDTALGSAGDAESGPDRTD